MLDRNTPFCSQHFIKKEKLVQLQTFLLFYVIIIQVDILEKMEDRKGDKGQTDGAIPRLNENIPNF